MLRKVIGSYIVGCLSAACDEKLFHSSMCLSVDVVQVMVQHIWIQSSSSGKATLLHPSFPLTLHPTSLLQEVSFEYFSLFKWPRFTKPFTNKGGLFSSRYYWFYMLSFETSTCVPCATDSIDGCNLKFIFDP